MSDPNFDRVLGAAARRGREVGACPDAEQLAAFVDGVLPRAEREAIEAHAADCARCTEHLALLLPIAATTPVRRAARPLLVRWGWLVPVATAVVVAAIWVRMPERPVQAPVISDTATAPAERTVDSETDAAPPAPAVTPGDRADTAASGAADSAAAKPVEAQRRREAPQLLKQSAPEAVTPATPAETSAGGASPEATAVREPDEAKTEAAPSTTAMTAPARTGRREPSSRFLFVAPPTVEVDAGRIRYRATGRRLERSEDSGATWRVVEADAGAPFSAGACAPDGACWFGTSLGHVFHVANGRTTRLELPVRSPVVSVTSLESGGVEVALLSGDRFRATGPDAPWTPAP